MFKISQTKDPSQGPKCLFLSHHNSSGWPQCHNSPFFAKHVVHTYIRLGNRRDKFTIHSKAVVCQDVELKGDITIGSGLESWNCNIDGAILISVTLQELLSTPKRLFLP